MAQFIGFAHDMFSVYVPEKWSSNVHTLTRMRNKDMLLALCDAMRPALGADLTALDRKASDEFPNIVNNKRVEAQWVYWYRDAPARQALAAFLERTLLQEKTIFDIAPQDRHAILAVTLRQSGLWAGLRLGPSATIDRRNLMAKLSQTWERENAQAMLAAMPEGCVVRLGDVARPCAEFDGAALAGLADVLTPEGPELTIGLNLDVAAAVDTASDLPSHVAQVLAAALPLYRFAAWTRDNDLIAMSKELQSKKVERRARLVNFSAGDHVRIVSGLFSGKVGVVQDVDAKAQVRVRVGKLSVTVGGQDLAAS